jgi:DNA-directed RNA polymerase subunit RPC12/RpoP
MKIQGKCDTCGRRFHLSQIGPDSDAPGRCPSCGARFARHYNAVLVDTVAEVERASSQFVDSMNRLSAMEKGFTIEHDELIADVIEAVKEHDKHLSAG